MEILPPFGSLQEVDDPPAHHHSKGGASGADQRVPDEDIAQMFLGSKMSQSRFLNSSKRTNFIPTATSRIVNKMNRTLLKSQVSTHLGLMTPSTAAAKRIQ
jgi:hypothetical protein